MPEASSSTGGGGRLSRMMGSVYHMAALRYGSRPTSHAEGVKRKLRDDDDQSDEEGDDDEEEEEEGEEEEDSDGGMDNTLRHKANAARNALPLSFQKKSVDASRPRLRAALRQAEDTYRSGHAASKDVLILRTNALRTSGDASASSASAARFPGKGDAIDDDGGLERTRVRAMLAQTRPMTHDDRGGATMLGDGGDDDALDDDLLQRGSTSRRPGGGRAKAVEGTADSIYLGDRVAIMPTTRSTYDSTRVQQRLSYAKRQSKGKGAGTKLSEQQSQLDEDPAIDATNDDEELARQTSAEIEEMRRIMPDSSLMAVVHFLASHYYESRDLMFPRTVMSAGKRSKKAVKKETEVGMLRACEGSALVAMAVYLEELAKWEAGLSASVDEPTSHSVEDTSRIRRLRDARARLGEVAEDEAKSHRKTLRKAVRNRRRLARMRSVAFGKVDGDGDEMQGDDAQRSATKRQRNERGRFAGSSLRAWTGRARMQDERRRSLKRSIDEKKRKKLKSLATSGGVETTPAGRELDNQSEGETEGNDSDETGTRDENESDS